MTDILRRVLLLTSRLLENHDGPTAVELNFPNSLTAISTRFFAIPLGNIPLDTILLGFAGAGHYRVWESCWVEHGFDDT
jgi:hypothetical protein